MLAQSRFKRVARKALSPGSNHALRIRVQRRFADETVADEGAIPCHLLRAHGFRLQSVGSQSFCTKTLSPMSNKINSGSAQRDRQASSLQNQTGLRVPGTDSIPQGIRGRRSLLDHHTYNKLLADHLFSPEMPSSSSRVSVLPCSRARLATGKTITATRVTCFPSRIYTFGTRK